MAERGSAPEGTVDALTGVQKWRRLSGWPNFLKNVLLGAITLLCAAWSLEIQHYVGIAIFKEQFLALIFGLAMAAIFIGLKPTASTAHDRVPLHDWLLAAMSLVCGLFVLFVYRDIVETIGELRAGTHRARRDGGLFGVRGNAARYGVDPGAAWRGVHRLFGAFPPRARDCSTFPAPRPSGSRFTSISTTTHFWASRSTLRPALSSPSSCSDACCSRQTGIASLNDFALVTMGKYRGGPAKVAVMASSLFGTISGSAVSNVVMDRPHHYPDDAPGRLFGTDGGRNRSGGVDRGPGDAARHGDRGVPHDRHSADFIWRGDPGRAAARDHVLHRAVRSGRSRSRQAEAEAGRTVGRAQPREYRRPGLDFRHSDLPAGMDAGRGALAARPLGDAGGRPRRWPCPCSTHLPGRAWTRSGSRSGRPGKPFWNWSSSRRWRG